MGLRVARRSKVNFAVRLFNPEFGYFDAIATDISDSGFFIRTKPHYTLMDKLQKMVLLDAPWSYIIFNIEKVRESDRGIGFRFINYEVNGEKYELAEMETVTSISQQLIDFCSA